jgi:tetratricopeptide (TPR) repeat protein
VSHPEGLAGQDGEAPARPGARLRRWLGLVALALPLALLIVAAVVLPGWVPLWPRAVRRAMTETFLRGVLLTYTFLLLVGLVGFPITAGLMVRDRRQRRRRPVIGRLFLFVFSCLMSLVALEIGATVLRSWMHRFPVLPSSFPEKEPGEYRIVVLGGSSALGEPFRPWLSVGQIVAWKLQEAFPDRRFPVEILAYLGDSLEKQHQKLSAVTERPDAMIIYSGHNEFSARFEENRDAPLDEEPRFRLLLAAYRFSLRSPFCRLVYELVSKNRLDSPPSLDGRHRLIDPPLCSPSESAEILADFSARLEALVGYCERVGTLPILIVPPGNEADFEPSRSTLPPTVAAVDRDRLIHKFQQAREAETTDPKWGQSLYQAILDRHPSFAEAHYRLGRLLLNQNQIDEARRHFSQALENDGLPIRCRAPFRDVYRQVAARHPGCLLIDGRAELMQASPTGLLDDHVMEDTHHPNLKGYVILAGAVLRELSSRRVFGGDTRLSRPLDPAECRDHFQLNADRLATACERTSVHYKRVSGYRYDPKARLEKSRRFAEAAAELRAGAVVEAGGLPQLSAFQRARPAAPLAREGPGR